MASLCTIYSASIVSLRRSTKFSSTKVKKWRSCIRKVDLCFVALVKTLYFSQTFDKLVTPKVYPQMSLRFILLTLESQLLLFVTMEERYVKYIKEKEGMLFVPSLSPIPQGGKCTDKIKKRWNLPFDQIMSFFVGFRKYGSHLGSCWKLLQKW